MRTVNVSEITEVVKELFIKANYVLPGDVYKRLLLAQKAENNELAKGIIGNIIENADVARCGEVPICQDCGMAFVFAEIGQDVHIDGGLFNAAVNEGVRNAYKDGYLRKSVVSCPLLRGNTGDNTPAVIYTELVSGDKIKITAMPKGFGSENMSKIKMFNPTASVEDICAFVCATVKEASGNPCPPIIVGVGIGGSFDYSAVLSKKALMRDIGRYSEKYSVLEKKLLEEINKTGVGVQGLGGDTTALWVAVEGYPTHIAGLPVAVNISCHATRHCTAVI